MSFGEYSLPTDTLAAILSAYPFSVGLLREILQNSDDARASKQVFVLDKRLHGTQTLVDPKLASTQGPSLLAYNDALFSENDWDALQSIHRSSKKTDTSTIGKYGIGFRSCYHVTDNPQIISGPTLAILDPHHHFAESGGTKFDFAPKAVEYSDQLDAFDFFLPVNARQQDFPGSVIRLPLRRPGAQSSISSKAVNATEIRQLFEDFIREEIGISLLFLKHIAAVEIHEVDAQGGRRCLAKSTIRRDAIASSTSNGDRHTTFKCTATVETPLLGCMEKTWRIVHSYFPEAYSTSLLSLRLGQDPRGTLEKHKLLSEMALAIPMTILTQEETSGRLFTYLPLPLKTGFPANCHALFALTASRQNLNNGGEIGIVRGSEDSVLVEWNKILFEYFLPRTWAALLKVLLQDDHLTEVFRAWPPAQSVVFGGDTAYWQSLPAKLLACIVSSKAEVWPVVTSSKGETLPHFAELGSLLVASTDVDEATLRALANAGLRVTQLPEYILQLLKENNLTDVRYTFLSPNVAYLELCSHVADIQALDAADRTALLQFLLKYNHLENLVGLPLVPLVNGEFLAPVRCGNNAPTHTMMDQAECDIFKTSENSGVSLSAIPSQFRDLFRAQGPSTLNVANLSPDKVASYLNSSPLGFDLSSRHEGKLDDAVVVWLSAFWSWLGVWPSRDLVFPHIHALCVVPTKTSLESPEFGVFSELGAEESLMKIFQALGLGFLHPAFSAAARTGLAHYPLVLKGLGDIHLVLDRMKPGQSLRLEKDEAYTLSKHMLDGVFQSQQRPLDENQRQKLRSLPIFSLLSPSVVVVSEKSPRVLSGFKLPSLHRKSTKSVSVPLPNLGYIAEDATVLGIPSGNTLFLPDVKSVVYLDGAHVDLALLPQLAPSNGTPLSSIDILALAVEHFALQSRSLQSSFLDHMVRNRDSLPPNLLKSLQKAVFISVVDGTLQSPERCIDPTKPDLVVIYSESKDRIPTTQAEDLPVLRHLRSLGLLPATLTLEIVAERIQFLSSRSALAESRPLAIQLLNMIHSSALDCTSLEIPLDAKWLPTSRGLVGRGECFDVSKHPELFDEVLPVLDRGVKLSPSLRTALGWDQPVSMTILHNQIREILSSGRASTVKLDYLIKELSSRTLSEADITELSVLTFDKPWIPIASGRLASTNYAVFSSTFGLAGFYQIPFGLADQASIRDFLVRMGCAERPSSSVLVGELKALEKKSRTHDVVDQAILILTILAQDLKSVDRKDILVPDSNARLRPVAEVYFNDVGERACLIDPGQHYLAHSKISDELSKKLLMDRLGFKSVELTPLNIDMGLELVTTIRNTLKQYAETQICGEFLANAADAEATKFGMLVDERPGPVEKLLSVAMVPFQTCPSLVMYNSGVFGPADWQGICRTGVGGKENRPNLIGRFGLGALSMFHFTELAMVVSGAQVLFLDPSKTHLPVAGRASLLLPLDQVKRWYPDHLQCLDGLFGFHLNRGTYNGTLFRLPLRNASHVNTHSILNTSITAQYVRDKIVKPYRSSAKHALIFTKLESVETFHRESFAGIPKKEWSISATRDSPVQVFQFRSQLIHIRNGVEKSETEDFKVVSVSCQLNELPSEFTPLVEPHRLRSPIVVGLAAPLTQSNANHHVFSTLPLPMTTTLPVHLTASFLLTPDRRHIRLDDYNNPETKYNRWLLSDVAPPLYLFLLEDLLRTQAALGNEAWWPGNTNQPQDSVSKHLVEAFYETHLASTKRRVCSSVFEAGQQCRPSDVLLGGKEPAPVTKILALLNTPHLVRLPENIRARCKGMKTVDAAFVQAAIKQKSRTLISLFQKGEISVKDIQALTGFLMDDPAADLKGLPLLPLADGTLAVLSSGAFYVWKPNFPERVLLQARHLVNPDFDATKFLDKGLVTKFTIPSLEKLIKEHFPEAPEKDLKPEQEEWCRTFWAEYPFGLGSEPKFLTFPLVRTTRPGHYVSLNKCWTNSVILASNSEPYWLCKVLGELGASVVQRDSQELSKPLREILKIQPAFSFDQVLTFFQTIQSSIPNRFAKLDGKLHAEFADWARGLILRTPDALMAPASALPIWKKLQQEQAVTLHAATEVKMLPFGISRDVALRFIGVPSVEYNPSLLHLKVVPLTFNQFWSHLKLPTTLHQSEEHVYKQLLTVMPSNFIFNSVGESILVPNGNRLLVKANTLFTRHALFVAAFGSDSSPTHFMLDIFRDLEPRLVSLGLKSQTNLDIPTFKMCAQAIQADATNPNITARARIVFKSYTEDVPLFIASSAKDTWKELDELRFIPREPLRRRTMGIEESSVYVKHLPATLVSPGQVLLAENEAVAWTQRAVLLYPPEERLLLANPSFGTPTAQEVVEHLRVLALQVAKDYTQDIYLLSDLEATYKWLEVHQHEIWDSLIEFHDELLFLNVDDPKKDPWLWHCADEMFFNIVDGGDLKSVKKFLQPFKDLLTVAGVEDIVRAPVPSLERATVDAQLSLLRAGFQSMRLEGKLTDVVFVANDDARYGAHRAYLAPQSEYLNDLFCGSFTEAGPGTADDPVEIEVDYSGVCVEAVLDYLYLTKVPALERLEDLLDVMDLSNYWGLDELNQLVQAKIIGNNQISPATYEEVVARATDLSATLLLNACEYFERENRDAILRLKGEHKGKRRSARRLPKKEPPLRHIPVASTSSASGSGTTSGSLLKLKPPVKAKKAAKGFMKGLRKVGDAWNFLD